MAYKNQKFTPSLKGDFSCQTSGWDFSGSLQGLPASRRQGVNRKIKMNEI